MSTTDFHYKGTLGGYYVFFDLLNQNKLCNKLPIFKIRALRCILESNLLTEVCFDSVMTSFPLAVIRAFA